MHVHFLQSLYSRKNICQNWQGLTGALFREKLKRLLKLHWSNILMISSWI